MKKIDLYIELSTKYLGEKERITGYILTILDSKNEPLTANQWFRSRGTYHRATIVTITKALERIKPGRTVVIHSDNRFVLDMIQNNLRDWIENDFQDKKGNLIKNAEEWKSMCAAAQDKNLECIWEKCHEYSTYMEWTIKRIKENMEHGQKG